MLLPGCTTKKAADARRILIASLVAKLRKAKKDSFIERVMEQGAKLPDEGIERLVQLVDASAADASDPLVPTSSTSA